MGANICYRKRWVNPSMYACACACAHPLHSVIPGYKYRSGRQKCKENFLKEVETKKKNLEMAVLKNIQDKLILWFRQCSNSQQTKSWKQLASLVELLVSHGVKLNKRKKEIRGASARQSSSAKCDAKFRINAYLSGFMRWYIWNGIMVCVWDGV